MTRIPEAAVEAAARDLYRRSNYQVEFSAAPLAVRGRFIQEAKWVLEAAAPHLMAQAWSEGESEVSKAQAGRYFTDPKFHTQVYILAQVIQAKWPDVSRRDAIDVAIIGTDAMEQI